MIVNRSYDFVISSKKQRAGGMSASYFCIFVKNLLTWQNQEKARVHPRERKREVEVTSVDMFRIGL